MKFSSSLKFNAVPEWWDDYIAYDTLKKYVYQLEKQQVGYRDGPHDLEANESTALITNTLDHTAADAVFLPLLDRELKKISLFYTSQEEELMASVTDLERLVQIQEDFGPDIGHQYDREEYEDDDEDEEEDDFVPQSPEVTYSRSPLTGRRRRSQSDANYASGSRRPPSRPNRRYSLSSNEDHGDLEASLASLRTAAQADAAAAAAGQSSSGVRSGSGRGSSRSPIRAARMMANKIFAKDSVSSSILAPDTVWTAKNDYATDIRLLFKRRITNLYLSLTSLRAYVELNYTGFRKILKKYDKVMESELKDHYLHDVVEQAHPFLTSTKDRLNHTIDKLIDLYARCITRWDYKEARRQLKLSQRENIAWERDTVWRQMIGQARRGGGDPSESSTIRALGGTLVVEPEKGLLDVETPAGRFKLTVRQLSFIISVTVFVILLNVHVVDGVEANRCLAILILATLLWATEAIPLFVTSMGIPMLLVLCQVIRDKDGERLDAHGAAEWICSVMFSPTILLLIGGFTIAAALSKSNIDRVLITRVLSLAGTKPHIVLLAFMGVSCFASMWISNVAAPTLCFTLIKPILRTLPPRSSFGPCLILAIALSANIGGQSSPISSPQNLIAIQFMDTPIGWAQWFAVALPVSAISILLIWLLLLVSYKPARSPDGEGDIEIRPIRASRDRFTLQQYWVCFICITTIVLWIIEKVIDKAVGDMGIIALLPIVAFFSTGVLKKDDFDQFLWTVVFLAMGGIALGKGVMSSGLLEVMDDVISSVVAPLKPYEIVLTLSFITLVVSTFISHTIASVLLVPIAKQVAETMDGSPVNTMIFLTALICSTGMGMPVSGFPNQTAATQEDDLGQLYLSNIDFLKNGVPASVIAMLVVSTIGYLLMGVVIR